MLAFQLYACAFFFLRIRSFVSAETYIFWCLCYSFGQTRLLLRFLRVLISASTFDNTRYHSCFMRMHCFSCACILLVWRLHHLCDFCVATSARCVIFVMNACFDSNDNVFKMMSMINFYAHAWFFLRIRCFDLAYAYVFWSGSVKILRMGVCV